MPIQFSGPSGASWGRFRGAVVAAAVVLAVAPSVALAHTRLVASNPAADSRVAAAPRELRLTFSEKSELAVSRVQLLGPDGKAVALAPLAAAPGDSGRTMVASVRAPLAPGTYTVVWQVVGRDGHPVRGRFSFVVGSGTGAGDAASRAGDAGHAEHAAVPTQRSPAQPAVVARPPRD